jgi:hypothetical protein
MEHDNSEHRREPARDGEVRECGALVGGLRHGVWRTWDAGGVLVTEAMYWRGERVWAIEYRARDPRRGA